MVLVLLVRWEPVGSSIALTVELCWRKLSVAVRRVRVTIHGAQAAIRRARVAGECLMARRLR